MKKIRLQEARVNLAFVINCVRKTRDRTWSLFGLVIALELYFSHAILNENYSDIQLVLFCMTSLLVIITMVAGHKAIFPSVMRDMGVQPERSSDLNIDDILHTYQISINKNGQVLDEQVKAYKRCVYILYVYLILSILVKFISAIEGSPLQ
jgi:hypothetical protein